MKVFQTLSNLNTNYLIPKRITSSEREVIKRMDEDSQEIAVESASVSVETGCIQRFPYVPSTSGEGTTVSATNLRVGPEEAETFCRRYSRRWQIENEHRSMKDGFLTQNVPEGLPRSAALLRLGGALVRRLATHGLPAESGR